MMLLSPPIFTSTHLPSTNTAAAPSSKRRCINPVLSASRALHAMTSATPTNTLPSAMLFGAPLQMPLSPPMEGTASLPRRRALRKKQVDDEGRGKKRKISTSAKIEIKVEENKKEKKMPRALFATPEQRSLPTEVPRGLTRTIFAQAFEPSRPRGWSDQDDQDLIALVADSLSSSADLPNLDNYTTTPKTNSPSTPQLSTRKRRRED